MVCPGSPDPLADVQTAAGACLGGWAEVMTVEGTRLWLQPESSWEEVWRLEKVLGVGREPGLALRLKEVEAGLAPACLHPPAAAWHRGRVLCLHRSGAVAVVLSVVGNAETKRVNELFRCNIMDCDWRHG